MYLKPWIDEKRRAIAKKDARVSSAVSPKRQREGSPVTDVLPPEVRRGRMGDKCWPRDQSITESGDEGKRTKRRSERKMWKGERGQDGGKRKSGVVTLRIEFRIAVADRFLRSHQMFQRSTIRCGFNLAERENILFE